MGASGIEWTDYSWNPLRARNRASGGIGHFCVHVSQGCRHCYAERDQPRFQNPVRFAAQDRAGVDLFLDDRTLVQPLRWRRPRMVFVCSMTDLFAEFHADEWIDRVFAVMALSPRHTFQVLTKRPERMRAYVSAPQRAALIAHHANRLVKDLTPYNVIVSKHLLPLPNVWLGTSVEDQAHRATRG